MSYCIAWWLSSIPEHDKQKRSKKPANWLRAPPSATSGGEHQLGSSHGGSSSQTSGRCTGSFGAKARCMAHGGHTRPVSRKPSLVLLGLLCHNDAAL
jgi:hypothetical protein